MRAPTSTTVTEASLHTPPTFLRPTTHTRTGRASGPARVRTTLAALVASLLVGGCATLSETECKTADWRQIGAGDGQRGAPTGRLNDHIEACAKVGIRPDANQYYAGRNAGIRLYCTPRSGYERGSRDSVEDSSVCPVELAGGYLDGFRLGKRVHEARSPVERLDRESKKLQERLRDAKTDQERASLRDELSRNDRALSNARRTLRNVEDLTSRTLRTVEETQAR
jgi:hypothetical protein